MECNNNGIPRIVRGNDFTLRVEVKHPVLTSEGNTELENFDISECTDIKVALVTRLGRRKEMPFTIGDNAEGTEKIILVSFDETVPSGLYGLEIIGKDKEGNDWRYYGAPGEVLQIVEPTSAAHIPSDDTTEGYYDLKVDVGVIQFSQKLLSDMGEVLEESKTAVKDSKQATEECVSVTKAAKEATNKANNAVDTFNKVLKETLTISLSCNHDENIIGKKVYVKDSEDDSILEQHDWQGDTIKTEVAPDQKYYIECEELEGYSLPKSDKFTAISGNVRELSLAYESEWFYPTLQMEDGTDCDGETCEYTNLTTGKRQPIRYTKGMCIKVPMNTSYQLVPRTKEGYYSGIFISRCASEAEYHQTATYKAAQSVIGIQMLDGTIVPPDDWDDTKYNRGDVNGIIVCTTGVQCIIPCLTNWYKKNFGFPEIGKRLEGLDCLEDFHYAKGQLGQSNTNAVIKYLGEGSINAFTDVANTFLPSGRRCYLPALDELQALFQNKRIIEKCYNLLGAKKVLSTFGFFISSTQKEYTKGDGTTKYTFWTVMEGSVIEPHDSLCAMAIAPI